MLLREPVPRLGQHGGRPIREVFDHPIARVKYWSRKMPSNRLSGASMRRCRGKRTVRFAKRVRVGALVVPRKWAFVVLYGTT